MAEPKKPLKEVLAEAAQQKPPEATKEKSSLGEVLYEALGKVWDGAVPMVEHGAAEITSALYTGNAYVPYGWSHTEPGQEQAIEAPKTPEATKEVEQDRGLER